MARKDKPYLPLYIQDLLTDEKLIECSAEAHGVYFRLMCLLHKQDVYGLLCLKQKYKQIGSKVENFASLLCKQMPFEQKQIQKCLQELSDEDVIKITEDHISQKRMLADGKLSLVRSEIGKKGGNGVTKQYGKKGFLYWIGDNENKNKIGISINVLNRLYRLRSDLGLKKLQIIETIEVDDMGATEDVAHLFFDKKRDGEWINLSHKEMIVKFALLKAKVEANIGAKVEANIGAKVEANIGAKVEANTDIDIDIENKKKYILSKTQANENINENMWTEIKKSFFNDYRWKEKFCRDKAVSLNELDEFMQEFLKDIELKEDFKELKELKAHLTNLFNQKKRKEKNIKLENKGFREVPKNVNYNNIKL